ncbi:tail fiber domain-containing protein [Agrobacterium tumefaciens]|nr:tail fiber domain-containing protein [Agrobacterium tumefaciens]
MASQPKTTTQTTQTEPWSGAKPYLQSVYAQYDTALQQGKPQVWTGPTVANQSNETKLAQQMAMQAATNGNTTSMLNNATNATNNLIQTGGANQQANQTYSNLMNGLNLGSDPSMGGIAALLSSTANTTAPGSQTYANVANSNNPGVGASQSALTAAQGANPTNANLQATASGANIGNNPYLNQSIANNQQNIADMLKNSTLPSLNGQAAALGRNGSGAFASQINTATGTAANQMAKVATDMYANQYNTDVNNMLAANTQLSNNHNTGVQNQISAANNLGNAFAQNANTQLTGAQGLDQNYQNSISNLSSLLGQQSNMYNQGVSNNLNNANLTLNAANAGTNASQGAANTQLNAANNAGNIYQNSLLPAETIGNIGAMNDAYAQQVLNGQISQWDLQQQTPLIQLANFANILNGGGYNSQTSQTTQPGNSALSNILGLGTSFLGFLSDRRTKENIVRVGKSPNGWDMYSYNYIGDDETYVGPMAQEVEVVRPELVTEIDGLKWIHPDTFKDLSISESVH